MFSINRMFGFVPLTCVYFAISVDVSSVVNRRFKRL